MDNLDRLEKLYLYCKVCGVQPHQTLKMAPEDLAFDMLVMDAGYELEKRIAHNAQKQGAWPVVVGNP